MAIQKTYSMIKPDGVRNGHIGEIVNRFERAGLTVERMELGMVTLDQAKANYGTRSPQLVKPLVLAGEVQLHVADLPTDEVAHHG